MENLQEEGFLQQSIESTFIGSGDCNHPHIQRNCLKNVEKPLEILPKSYSLDPDMISGWIPKLPSIPISLQYGSSLSYLIRQICKEQLYQIVYHWKNEYYNTVKVHKKYDYKWEHRAKYEVNIGLLQNAVKMIGRPAKAEQAKVQQTASEFKFNSNFQSGNLGLSVRVKPMEYDCYLRNDTNTNGHTNWYYFSIENGMQIGNLKINICNMKKSKTLYQSNMQPFVSIADSEPIWQQGKCQNVVVMERYCRHIENLKEFQLQFNFKFMKPKMKVYFAYGVPYTYSDLQAFTDSISENSYLQNLTLGESYSSLSIPLLKITNRQNNFFHNKRTVVMMGRIHPGQSNSSHVIEGFIKQLVKDTQHSEQLRNAFQFYIIPMINVDGVVMGNFRCGVQGKDMNREFKKQKNQTSVIKQVNLVTRLLQKLKQNGKQVSIFIDFHGHSSKKNCFFYGPQHPQNDINFLKSRLFARLFEQKCFSFKYNQSVFQIPTIKLSTARGYMNKRLHIPITFTLQTSNGLYTSKQNQDLFYSGQKFGQIGRDLVHTFYSFVKYQKITQNVPALNQVKNLSSSRKNLSKNYLNLQNNYANRDSTLKKRYSHKNKKQLFVKNADKKQQTEQDIIMQFLINIQKKKKSKKPQYAKISQESDSDIDSENNDLQFEKSNHRQKQHVRWQKYFEKHTFNQNYNKIKDQDQKSEKKFSVSNEPLQSQKRYSTNIFQRKNTNEKILSNSMMKIVFPTKQRNISVNLKGHRACSGAPVSSDSHPQQKNFLLKNKYSVRNSQKHTRISNLFYRSQRSVQVPVYLSFMQNIKPCQNDLSNEQRSSHLLNGIDKRDLPKRMQDQLLKGQFQGQVHGYSQCLKPAIVNSCTWTDSKNKLLRARRYPIVNSNSQVW